MISTVHNPCFTTDLHDLGPGPTGLPDVRLVLCDGLEEAVGAVVVLGEGGGHPAPLLGEGGRHPAPLLGEGDRHSAPRAGPVPCQVHSTVSAARLLGLDTSDYEIGLYFIISEYISNVYV